MGRSHRLRPAPVLTSVVIFSVFLGLTACTERSQPSSLPPPPDLVSCDLACVEAHAADLAASGGPKFALDWVAAIDVDGVRYACHAVHHAVGRAAAARSWPEFPELASLECQYGYLHGVLQGRAGRSSLEEWVSTTYRFCAALDEKSKSECLHGLGHGAAVTTPDDLFQVMLACDSLPGRVSTPCADGAMMEFADDVWQRAGMLHWETGYVDVETTFDPADTKALCERLPVKVSSSCWTRAADMVAPLYRNDPLRLSELCTSAPSPKDVEGCLYAAAVSAVENFYDDSMLVWPPESSKDAKVWVRAAAEECSRWASFDVCLRGAIAPTFSHIYSGGLWELVKDACVDEPAPIREVCNTALKEAIVIAN